MRQLRNLTNCKRNMLLAASFAANAGFANDCLSALHVRNGKPDKFDDIEQSALL